jgi:hypothetical protein
LADYVSDDIRFKDPFNDVHGADAMHRVFRHMFDSVGNVRSTVHRAVLDGDTCLMDWWFEGLLPSKPRVFEGPVLSPSPLTAGLQNTSIIGMPQARFTSVCRFWALCPAGYAED